MIIISVSRLFNAGVFMVSLLCFLDIAQSQTLALNARCSGLSLSNTQVRHLYSKSTQENIQLSIAIPAGYYENPQKSYPLLVLLDADYSFPIAKSVVDHLADRERIRAPLIVGIGYVGPPRYRLNRTRDYTPTYVASGGYGPAYQKVSGGAPKFALFIQNELLPYLKTNFRLTDESTLVGHSYGGLFASWLSLVNPRLFSSYLIVSPSLWYDRPMMFTLQARTLKDAAKKDLPKLFFGIGDQEDAGDYPMIADLTRFVKSYQDVHVTCRYQVFRFEDHDTVFPAAFSHGLMYLYGRQSA